MLGTAVPEVKVLDNNSAAASSVWAGASIVPGNNFSPVALNLIQTGSSFFNRIGRKVRMHSLFIEANAFPGNAANTEPTYNRFVVVYDRQPNGATPALADVLQDVSQTNALTNPGGSVLCHMNMNNRERFIMLMDERKFLPPAAAVAPYFTSPVVTHPDEFKIKRFIPLKMLETHFKADSSPAVIGDIATGSLIFFAIADTTIAAQTYAWEISARLKFDDM